jgi:hypothetical protein
MGRKGGGGCQPRRRGVVAREQAVATHNPAPRLNREEAVEGIRNNRKQSDIHSFIHSVWTFIHSGL